MTAAGAHQERGTNTRNVFRAMSSSALASAVAVPVSLLVTPLVVHGISLAGYGVWSTLSAFVAVGALADLGIGTEISRRVAEANGRGDPLGAASSVRRGVTLLLMVAVAMTAGTVVAAPAFVAVAFPGLHGAARTDASHLLVAVTCLLAGSLVLGACFAPLAGLQRVDYRNYGAILGSLSAAGVTAGLITTGHGVWALWWGAFASNACSWAVQAYGAWRLRMLPLMRLAWPFRKGGGELLGLSTLILVANVSNLFDWQIDKLLLAHYQGPAAAGSYGIGTNLVLQARLLVLFPLGILTAATAELFDEQPHRVARLESSVVGITFGLSAIVFGGLILFSRSFMGLWIGDAGRPAEATQLLAVAMYVNVLAGPWFAYSIGRKWHRLTAWSAVSNLVVNGTLSYALVRAVGFAGPFIGSIAGNCVGVTVMYWLLRRRERRPLLRALARPVVVTVAVLAVGLVVLPELPALSWLGLVAAVCCWIVVCAGLLVLTQVWRPRALIAMLAESGRLPMRHRAGADLAVGVRRYSDAAAVAGVLDEMSVDSRGA